MKKILLLAFLMLTVLPLFSQEDTVELPFSIGKEIALDLAEKDRLQALEVVNALELVKYQSLVSGLEKVIRNQGLQIGILNKQLKTVQVWLEAEKQKKKPNNWFTWLLATIAAFGTGYLVGNI